MLDDAQIPTTGGTPDPAGRETEKAHVVQTPRQLLVAIAVALVVIGWQTFRFPPEYLALAPLWCAVSIVAGLACAAAAINPRRFYVATSGATVVCATSARALALVNEVLDRRGGVQAGYIVGASAWALIALLSFVTWREYVLPWSLVREQRHRR